MKNLTKFFIENQIIIAVSITAILTMIFFYLKNKANNKNIEEAFVKADLADEKEIINKKTGSSKKEKYIKFSKRKNKIILKKFNKGKSTHDFLLKKQLMTEIFQKDIISIERHKWNIIIKTADWTKEILQDQKKIILGYDGERTIYKDEQDNSMFCFGLSGSGKSTVLNSYINQSKRIYPNVRFKIFTPKPIDFQEHCFNEHNVDEFLEHLKVIEKEREEAELSKTKLQTKYIIICDEAHILNTNKEICEVINKFILIGRSQGIEIWLSSQKGTSSDYKNLHISQLKIKISVRNVESLSFGETIYTPEVAAEAFFNPLNYGFGYIKTPNIKGTKVKFYYE